MTAPAIAPAESIRSSRATLARDMARSKARIGELTSLIRAEVSQLAKLQVMAEIVGITDVEVETRQPDVIDAGVDGQKAEAPPAVGTPGGP